MGKKIKQKSIRDIVYDFPTKYEQGFTTFDQQCLLADYFPQYSQEELSEKIGVVTCMRIDDEFVIYHEDIINALYCLIENRELNQWEWD